MLSDFKYVRYTQSIAPRLCNAVYQQYYYYYYYNVNKCLQLKLRLFIRRN